MSLERDAFPSAALFNAWGLAGGAVGDQRQRRSTLVEDQTACRSCSISASCDGYVGGGFCWCAARGPGAGRGAFLGLFGWLSLALCVGWARAVESSRFPRGFVVERIAAVRTPLARPISAPLMGSWLFVHACSGWNHEVERVVVGFGWSGILVGRFGT